MTLSTVLIIASIICICIFIAHFFYSRTKEKNNQLKNFKLFTDHHMYVKSYKDYSNTEFKTQPEAVEKEKNNGVFVSKKTYANKQTQEQLDFDEQNSPFNLEELEDHENYEATGYDEYSYDQDQDETLQEIALQNTIPFSTNSNVESEDLSDQTQQQSINIDETSKQTIEPFYTYNKKATTTTTFDRATLIRKIQAQKQIKSNIKVTNVEPFYKTSVIKRSDKILFLYIIPKYKEYLFNGSILVDTLENFGLSFGRNNIFHKYLDTANSVPIFSVANIKNPGTFEYNSLYDTFVQGLTIFMVASSDLTKANANFKMMLYSAEKIAHKIDGVLLNKNQQIFSDADKDAYLNELLNSD